MKKNAYACTEQDTLYFHVYTINVKVSSRNSVALEGLDDSNIYWARENMEEC